MLVGMRHTVLALGCVVVALVMACGGTSPAEEYLRKGNDYVLSDGYEKAVQEYDEAIRLDPQHEDAYSNRGIAYGRLDQHERAVQDFDEAIRLDPQADAYYNRGVTYQALGMSKEAELDFAKAKELGYKP